MSMRCVNISNKALSTFSSIFIRTFRVGSDYFGVDSSGVYKFTGNTDDGEMFTSVIKTCNTHLDEPLLKRLPEIRLVNDGDIDALLLYDDTPVSEGVPTHEKGLIKLGKGGGGKVISLAMHSESADFKLYKMSLYSQVLGVPKG